MGANFTPKSKIIFSKKLLTLKQFFFSLKPSLTILKRFALTKVTKNKVRGLTSRR